MPHALCPDCCAATMRETTRVGATGQRVAVWACPKCGYETVFLPDEPSEAPTP